MSIKISLQTRLSIKIIIIKNGSVQLYKFFKIFQYLLLGDIRHTIEEEVLVCIPLLEAPTLQPPVKEHNAVCPGPRGGQQACRTSAERGPEISCTEGGKQDSFT